MSKQASDVAPREDLMSEIEAAAYLKISRTTIIRLRKAGLIEYTRMGNLVRYTRAQADQYIANCAQKTSA